MLKDWEPLKYAGMEPAPSPRGRVGARLKSIRLTVFAFLALVLCWLIIAHSFAAFLATTAPRSALFLNSNEARSLVTVADAEVNSSEDRSSKTADRPRLTPQRLTILRRQIQSAVANDPLPSKAYRLLGQIAELQGSAHEAEKFMLAATRHSLNEGLAVDWLMRRNFERKNYAGAAFYADVLLRSINRTSSAMPILAHMAEDKFAKQEVERLLSANPSWRPSFFNAIGPYLTDARTPLQLLLTLKDSKAPPTRKELNAYEAFLFKHKLYEPAYYVWLQFLAPEEIESAGFLFNGDFEMHPSGSAFDWQWSAGGNVVVDFAPRPENHRAHALLIELGPGRVEFPRVTQAVVLAPGPYLLKGSLMGEVAGPRGLQWGVKCMGGSVIGTSEMVRGSFPNWRAFEFPFVVPEAGCSAQMIQLSLGARSLSEQLVNGEIWFDKISISRANESTPN